MKTILSFYTKSCLKLITQYFLLALLLILTVKLFPKLELDKEESFIRSLIYFVAPFFYYFNSRVSVSSSLGWILLTPTKKTHILLANGIINILKVILILLATDTLYYAFTLETKDLIILKIFSFASPLLNAQTDVYGIFGLMSAPLAFFFVGALTLIILFLFSMAKSNNPKSTASNYSFPKNTKYLKKVFSLFGIMLVGSLLVANAEFIYEEIFIAYIPTILFMSLTYTGIILAFLSSTFASVRFSDQQFNIMPKVFIGSMIAMSLFLSIWACFDIKSKYLDLGTKLESFSILGPFASYTRDPILKIMKKGNDELLTTKPSEMHNFFLRIDSAEADNLQKEWVNLCHKRKDYICRIAAYNFHKIKDRSFDIELLRLSCPKDLPSCFLVMRETNDSLEAESMKNHLAKVCSMISQLNKIEEKQCRDFSDSIKKNNKEESKKD